nr:hypothetical protein GCM10020093_026680 [Planobispora longispora]
MAAAHRADPERLLDAARGTVFANLEREAKRIRYWDMLVKGQVRMVRKRAGGGYFTVVTPPEGAAPTKRIVFRSRFVHLAIGYPGLKFLPDLQEFRTKYSDYQHVVNAYEPHEQVYEFLKTRPGTVVIRGGGIVASRVLQRLFDDREKYGLKTQIIHIFRTFITGSHGPHIWARRKGGDGWAYQGFNYPKSVWGGQLKAQMRKLEGAERAAKYKEMGAPTPPSGGAGRSRCAPGARAATTTRCRARWIGWSPPRRPPGQLRAQQRRDHPRAGRRLHHRLHGPGGGHRRAPRLRRPAAVRRSLPQPGRRLEVERHFEVKGTASGDGALYASGSATLGGYFPGVDTFLGLQIAAQEIADDLAGRGFVRKMGPLRSTSQWFKWVFNSPV